MAKEGEKSPGARSSRSGSPWGCVVALILLAALAVAAPFVYRKYFLTAEGQSKIELEADRLKEKLKELKEGAEERFSVELKELKELDETLRRKAGPVRDDALEELRRRGLDPEGLKKRIEELRRKIEKRR